MCTCLYCNGNLICASMLHLGKSLSLVADDWQRDLLPTSVPGHFSFWLEGKVPQGTKGESFTCKTACSFQFQGEMSTDQWDVKHMRMKNRKIHRNVIHDSYIWYMRGQTEKYVHFKNLQLWIIACLNLMYLVVAGQSRSIHFARLWWRWGGWHGFCWHFSCKVSK